MRAKIALDTRKKSPTGKYKVKIRVSFHSDGKYVYRYFDTGESLFQSEFKKLHALPVAQKIIQQQSEANSILEGKPFITPEEFSIIFSNKGGFESVQGLIEIMRLKAKSNGQVSTYNLFGNTKASITKFVKSKCFDREGTLKLGELTPEFLNRYEDWMAEQGNSFNTVGIYTRNLRTVCNMAIEMNLIKQSQYPFGRNKYVPPVEVTKKRPLSIEQKDLFLSYHTADPAIKKLHAFCKLSLYCFGRNFSDIARWKWSNIENGTIKSYRTKTVRTRRTKEKIVIPITPEIQEIINQYGSKSLDPNAYVFDVLKPRLDPFQEKYLINEWIKDANAALKIICEELGIEKITTYTMRYTFAYIMKKYNVPIKKVQGMMGHENQKTTEIYQGSIEVGETAEVAKLIYMKGV